VGGLDGRATAADDGGNDVGDAGEDSNHVSRILPRLSRAVYKNLHRVLLQIINSVIQQQGIVTIAEETGTVPGEDSDNGSDSDASQPTPVSEISSPSPLPLPLPLLRGSTNSNGSAAIVKVNASNWYEENQEKEDEDLVAILISEQDMTTYYSKLLGCMSCKSCMYVCVCVCVCLCLTAAAYCTTRF
jgi:hypothetical protein